MNFYNDITTIANTKMTKMYVIKRRGNKTEPVSFDKIHKRIEWLVDNPFPLEGVNAAELSMIVISGLKNNIKTTDIDNHAAKVASSLATKHREYLILASRIAVNNHQKNTLKSFADKMTLLYLRTDKNGNSAPIVSSAFNKYVNIHNQQIDATIDYDRDYLNDYFGFKTLEKGYLLSIDDIVIERPQDLIMRAAIQMYMPQDKSKFRDTAYLTKIFRAYDRISLRYYTPATPTLFNSGAPYASLTSCFLAGSFDSLEGIMKSFSDACTISKGSGGVGMHVSMWRGQGSPIRGTNGTSDGIIPQLRIFNAGARAYNQGGGKRKGSWAIYLEPHHPDILNFLKLKLNDGADEETKCRDLFPAVWLSDLFMERVEKSENWSVFCPDECPGLQDAWGEDYKKLYYKYEDEGRARFVIPALKIWTAIKAMQDDAGVPYVMYKDNVNRTNMQNNIGTIKSSNLCVSGDTLILTDKGYYPIKELTEYDPPVHNVWNGDIFTPATFAKTGTDQELLEIETTHGNVVKCTPYHKFIIDSNKKEKIIEAKDLKINDSIIKNKFPIIEDDVNGENVEDFPYAYTHGFFTGDGTYLNHPLKNNKCPRKSKINSNLCEWHINMYDTTGESTEVCTATGIKIPSISLYGAKKDLIDELEKSVMKLKIILDKSNDKLTFYPPHDLLEKFIVPINYSKQSKLEWLAGLLDADGCFAKNGQYQSLQLCSINLEFLKEVKLMCNTLSVNPIISLFRKAGNTILPDHKGGKKEYECKERYRILFNGGDTTKLYKLGLQTKRLIYNGNELNQDFSRFNKIKSITKLEVKEDTYCFKEPLKSRGIFNGIITEQCTEITTYSDTEQFGTCNLHSICLPMFVEDTYSEEELELNEDERRKLDHEFPVHPRMNYRLLAEVAGEVTENINNVIDCTYNPVVEAARGNFRNRPIGIGIQGLADVFLKFQIPFNSEKARDINKKISETIYYGALSKSTELCREIYHKVIKSFDTNENTIYEHTLYTPHALESFPELVPENVIATYTNKAEVPKTIGAYPTYLTNGGSHMSHGKFHWEMFGLETKDLSGMFDWETLRNKIAIFGVRNSLLTAYMPTGTTSQIMGCSPCIEPYVTNIYKRKTLAGTFTVVNKYLIKYLQDMELYNEEFKDYLLRTEGCIKDVVGIPDNIKELYKTAWELPQSSIMQMAVDRQPFIDQSQSMNLWFDDYTDDKFTSSQFFAWRNGLKTGSYYIRTREAFTPQKFTISPDAQNNLSMAEIVKREKAGEHLVKESTEEICISCSS